MRGKLFFILILILAASTVTVYNQGYAMQTIKNKGYLIYMDYTWFFQPCNDSTVGVLESLNQTSFRIIAGTDGYNNLLYEIEKTLSDFKVINPIFYNRKQKEYVGELKYQFCELEYSNDFVNPNKNLHPCMYEIEANGRNYGLGCFFFDVRLHNYRKL